MPTNLIPAKAIAAGWSHNIALLTNGTVFAWGDNTYGQTTVPGDLTNATAIAAGQFHSLALRADGKVEAWGDNDDGQTNVPSSALSNIVAIAAGGKQSLALQSSGYVVAWGYGQTNLPSGMSNVMAIAAGSAHGVALKNDGSLVAWGDNSYGQTNVPAEQPTTVITTTTITTTNGPMPSYQTNTYPPIVVKLIAAGGFHSMAAIFSPLVQYPVDVSKDLLLIYNTNSIDSFNVCQYYLTNRPMVSNANVLGIGCTTNETFLPSEYTNVFVAQVQTWLATNPTIRPQYVILFQDIPSRVSTDNSQPPGYTVDSGLPSVQYQLNACCSTGWHPFVTAINMNGLNGAGDCTAYIDKLASMASNYSSGTLFISATTAIYGNTNWYFDGAGYPASGIYNWIGTAAEEGVTNADPTASVFGSINTHYPNYIATATNVAGYWTEGWDGGLGDANMFIDGTVRFFGNSGWYIMATIDSYNGRRDFFQAGFLTWFATDAFGGTNYSNTLVGGITHVDEPSSCADDVYDYYGYWASGRCFGICAWAGQTGNCPGYYTDVWFQAVGDPFVKQ